MAAKPAPLQVARENVGSERYLRICRRFGILPEPVFLRALRAPLDCGGIYTTLSAEALLDPSRIRSIILALDESKGLHTVRLVGLRKGSLPLFTKDTFILLMRTALVAPSMSALDLSDNALDDSIVAQPLEIFISRGGSIVSLNLSYNNLGDDSAVGIFSALEMNKSLRFLDLSCNPGLAKWPKIGKHMEQLLKMNDIFSGLAWTFADSSAVALLRSLKQAPSRYDGASRFPCV